MVNNDPIHESIRSVAFLNRLRDGDDAAYNELVWAYGASLIRYATGILDSVDLAHDVVQDVLLKLWRNRDQIEDSWDIGAYLYGRTRHRAIDIARSSQSSGQRDGQWVVQNKIESDSGSGNIDGIDNLDADSGDSDEIRKAVWGALQGVSPRCREVFMLVWDEHLPYLDIAHRMGLTEPTIRSYMSRALKQLAKVLKQNTTSKEPEKET